MFDKQYYEEIYLNSWHPRNVGKSNQDWTTGKSKSGSARMMLNTDLCLVFDIENTFPCCTRTNKFFSNGLNQCLDKQLSKIKCPHYSESDSRSAATAAVKEYLGGSYPNTNNVPFYTAFSDAWGKATTNGRENLSPLAESCEAI